LVSVFIVIGFHYLLVLRCSNLLQVVSNLLRGCICKPAPTLRFSRPICKVNGSDQASKLSEEISVFG
jgi:hypothetical protein